MVETVSGSNLPSLFLSRLVVSIVRFSLTSMHEVTPRRHDWLHEMWMSTSEFVQHLEAAEVRQDTI